jgi:hypothetical protein
VAPPFVGVAVKVTEVVAHTGLADAAAITLTGNSVLTIIVIVFDVAGLPVTHVAFEIITTVMASLFRSADEV